VSLRLKLVLALVALSAVATAAIGVFSYRTTSDQLRAQVDQSLVAATRDTVVRPGDRDRDDSRPPPGTLDDVKGPGEVVGQFVAPDGHTISNDDMTLPVSGRDLALANASRPAAEFRDESIDGEPFRMLTTAYGNRRGALQAARSLDEAEQVLSTLRTRILVAALVVMAVAALLGWIIARQVTRRLVRLTSAAEQVTATGDLAVEVPVSGTDETGRLGSAFNEMLHAIARSKEDQRRLVQDAGHELRTPLTSLRTNIFALRRSDELTAAQRAEVLGDLEGETEELTRLINEVVELATDRRGDEPETEVALAPLIERVAARASQRAGRTVSVRADDSVVVARELAVARVLGNLIENASKFDETGGPIEVECTDGRVEVADHGPGFLDADLPHVFDRFYRATTARGRPGSGLGLSIVADIVEQHGGTVFAGNRDGGGAVVGFQLPTV
jgi:two-component system, OmpR family, sensor histidine kinase MprB